MKKVFGIGIVLVLLLVLAWWFFDAPNDDGYALEYSDAFVMGPEECTSYETYDPVEEYCYYECDSEEECLEIERLIDEELAGFADAYETFAGDFGEYDGSGDDIETEAVYRIEAGEQVRIVSGDEHTSHSQILAWLFHISPDAFSDMYLHTFGVFNDPLSGDGAFVEPSLEVSGKWDMYVNRDVLTESEEEMIFTLLHEFAHILTLNETQVDEHIPQSGCDTHYIEEGCLQSGSYFHNFYTTFWSNGSGGYSPEYFVTEYASENPGEDIAESFALFVLDPRKHEERVARNKVNFFYQYEELVALRSDIREALARFVRARAR